MPQAFDGPSMSLEGHAIDIVAAEGLANTRYLWVPSLQAVFGGVLVFSGLHVWTADTPTTEARASRKPRIVVPGHTTIDGVPDASALTFTRDYLLAFEAELPKAKDGAALIEGADLAPASTRARMC
jgi:hypothetical protein